MWKISGNLGKILFIYFCYLCFHVDIHELLHKMSHCTTYKSIFWKVKGVYSNISWSLNYLIVVYIIINFIEKITDYLHMTFSYLKKIHFSSCQYRLDNPTKMSNAPCYQQKNGYHNGNKLYQIKVLVVFS